MALSLEKGGTGGRVVMAVSPSFPSNRCCIGPWSVRVPHFGAELESVRTAKENTPENCGGGEQVNATPHRTVSTSAKHGDCAFLSLRATLNRRGPGSPFSDDCSCFEGRPGAMPFCRYGRLRLQAASHLRIVFRDRKLIGGQRPGFDQTPRQPSRFDCPWLI